MDFRLFTCWVMLERSVDDDGWVGHCLEFDIVSQGDTAAHALDMIKEATALCLLDDLNDGVEPESVRNRAPKEYWESLFQMMKTGERVPLSEITSGTREVRKFAMQIVLPFVRAHNVELADAPPPMREVFSASPQQIAC
jgi:predicted RNase H-like HicB family nuclease